jgi:hypothetical protein
MPIERQPEAAAPTNVVNLMDALRRSVGAEKPAAARGKAAERKKTAKEAEQRPAKGARKAERHPWTRAVGAASGVEQGTPRPAAALGARDPCRILRLRVFIAQANSNRANRHAPSTAFLAALSVRKEANPGP